MVGYVVNVEAEVRAEAEARAALLREAAALEAGRAQVERLHAAMPALLFHRDCGADGSSRLLYRAGDIGAVTGWSPGIIAGMDSLEPLTVADVTFAGSSPAPCATARRRRKASSASPMGRSAGYAPAPGG